MLNATIIMIILNNDIFTATLPELAMGRVYLKTKM